MRTQTNESYLQMVVKYNPTHEFSVSPLCSETCGHLQYPGEHNKRLVQGPHVNLKTWRQNDQMHDGKHEQKGSGDGR